MEEGLSPTPRSSTRAWVLRARATVGQLGRPGVRGVVEGAHIATAQERGPIVIQELVIDLQMWQLSPRCCIHNLVVDYGCLHEACDGNRGHGRELEPQARCIIICLLNGKNGRVFAGPRRKEDPNSCLPCALKLHGHNSWVDQRFTRCQSNGARRGSDEPSAHFNPEKNTHRETSRIS